MDGHLNNLRVPFHCGVMCALLVVLQGMIYVAGYHTSANVIAIVALGFYITGPGRNGHS